MSFTPFISREVPYTGPKQDIGDTFKTLAQGFATKWEKDRLEKKALEAESRATAGANLRTMLPYWATNDQLKIGKEGTIDLGGGLKADLTAGKFDWDMANKIALFNKRKQEAENYGKPNINTSIRVAQGLVSAQTGDVFKLHKFQLDQAKMAIANKQKTQVKDFRTTLPDGRPNPNYGRPFIDIQQVQDAENWLNSVTTSTNVGLIKDTMEKLGQQEYKGFSQGTEPDYADELSKLW
jgi:hypothetical protein